jgi:hypothetical protein
VLQFLLSQL